MSFCHEETPRRITVTLSLNETDQLGNTGLRDRDDIPLMLEGKKLFLTGLDGIYLPMQLTDWLFVTVALLLIGLIQIYFVENWF
jgi:hypothetical protein